MRTCLMCCSVSMATRWWLSSAGASRLIQGQAGGRERGGREGQGGS